jgi:hypothetical protein
MARTKNRARRTSVFNLPSAFALFKPSRKIVLENIWIFGPLYFLFLIFSVHSWIWTPSPDSQNDNWWTDYSWFGSGFTTSGVPAIAWYAIVGFSIMWFVFTLAAGTIVQIMVQKAQLQGAKKHPIYFSELWAPVKEIGWRMLGLYLVMILYIVIGFILFIVPGFIMIRRYFFAPYIMLEKKNSIKEAMEESATMTKPFSGYIYSIIGVMTLIGIINAIPFIGWMISFILGLLYSVAPALRYLQIKRIHSASDTAV